MTFFVLCLSIAGSFSITPSSANAQVCHTLTQCRDLQTSVERRIQVLLTESGPNLDPILRHADGSIHTMTHQEADDYCVGRQTSLPTSRGLAIEAVRLGAAGIRETEFPELPLDNIHVRAEITFMASINYEPIYKPIDNTYAVDFYYNHTGYRTSLPADRQPIEVDEYWSSSMFQRSSSSLFNQSGPRYYLLTREGHLLGAHNTYYDNGNRIHRDTRHAVRCVSRP